MKKRKTTAFKKQIYLLGVDHDGIYHWLEESTWDCGWYWGGGYVETYNNNQYPEKARDINLSMHFDDLFFNKQKNGVQIFNEYFKEHPFTSHEVFQIMELMKSFYIARSYSNMLHLGGAHYTTNPAKNTIFSETEYKRINEIVIPEIMKNLYQILGDN